MGVYGRNGYIAPLVLNLGSSWRQMVKITDRPAYSGERCLVASDQWAPGKGVWCQLTSGIRGRSGRAEKSLYLAVTRSPDRQACGIVSTPITLSWFLNKLGGCNCLLLFGMAINYKYDVCFIPTSQQRPTTSHISGKPQYQLLKTPVCISSRVR
jgi:hypothetical protein